MNVGSLTFLQCVSKLVPLHVSENMQHDVHSSSSGHCPPASDIQGTHLPGLLSNSQSPLGDQTQNPSELLQLILPKSDDYLLKRLREQRYQVRSNSKKKYMKLFKMSY